MAEKKKSNKSKQAGYKGRQVGMTGEEVKQNAETTGEDAIGDTSARIQAPPGAITGINQGGITEELPPSENRVPYTAPEEAEMEMAPAVVGPPAYGSPDPATSAGRLVELKEHPLAHTLSSDYGADVKGVNSPRGPLEGTHPGSPGGIAEAEAATRRQNEIAELEAQAARERLGDFSGGSDLQQDSQGTDYDSKKVDDLKDEAKRREIEGYSSMNKPELVAALQEFDAAGGAGNEGNGE